MQIVYRESPAQSPQSTQNNYMNAPWSSGICDCCCGEGANPGFFCLACCCGGIAQGVLLKDLGLVSSCVGPVLIYTLVDVMFARLSLCTVLASLRMSVSDKLKRGEGPCGSICIACFCYPCALAQMDRDAKAHDRSYVFDKAEGPCDVATTYFGAIHGSVRPYVSAEMVPLVPNGM